MFSPLLYCQINMGPKSGVSGSNVHIIPKREGGEWFWNPSMVVEYKYISSLCLLCIELLASFFLLFVLRFSLQVPGWSRGYYRALLPVHFLCDSLLNWRLSRQLSASMVPSFLTLSLTLITWTDETFLGHIALHPSFPPPCPLIYGFTPDKRWSCDWLWRPGPITASLFCFLPLDEGYPLQHGNYTQCLSHFCLNKHLNEQRGTKGHVVSSSFSFSTNNFTFQWPLALGICF